MRSEITYKGVNRAGWATTGRAQVDDLPAFVKARYDAGWRELTVTCDDHEVGWISKHPDTGQRMWSSLTYQSWLTDRHPY